MSCKRNVRVGNKIFKYKKDLMAYVRKQINNDELDQDFLFELMQHHRTRKSDLYDDRNGCKRLFYVGNNAFCWKGPVLCIEGNKEPISWRHAIAMVFAKDLKVLKKQDDVRYSIAVMRHEVRFCEGSSLETFRKGVKGAHCALCDTEEFMQVDHYPLRFEDMVCGFLQERKMSYEDLGNMKQKPASFDDSGTIYLFTARTFAEDWIRYHEKRAQYRWLCRTCNVRGNQGHKKRKRK